MPPRSLSASPHPPPRVQHCALAVILWVSLPFLGCCARDTPSSALLVQPGFLTDHDDLGLHAVARVADPSLVGAGGISPSVATRPPAHAVGARWVGFRVWPLQGRLECVRGRGRGSPLLRCPVMPCRPWLPSSTFPPCVGPNAPAFSFWLLGLASSSQRLTPGILWGWSGARVTKTAAVVPPSTGVCLLWTQLGPAGARALCRAPGCGRVP